MKHVLPLLVILLYNLVQVTRSKVILQRLPKELRDCHNVDMTHQLQCIRNKFDDANWIPDTGEERHLRIRQDFFWHPTKRIRRECRALPREEWKALTDAINALKNDKSLSPNVYDYIADYHTNEAVDSVHFGPNFFGWHRVFILSFEELLRKVNPNVTLCYWDSRLDFNMDHPHNSIMFTDEFLGNTRGPVTSGPFANWKTIRNIPLRRKLGSSGSLIDPDDIDAVLSKKSHAQITTPVSDEDSNVETMHNMVHAYIGGQMNDFNTSSQDPYFWLHHAFIDSVWEKFCTKLREKGIDPQDDYVLIDSKEHQPRRTMDHLFPFKNVDGYSDYFPKYIYDYGEYAECPTCLNSPYLKCNKKENKCYSIAKDENKRLVYEPPEPIPTNSLSTPLDNFEIISGEENIKDWVILPVKVVFRDAVHKSIRSKNIAGCEYANTDPDVCSQSVVIAESKGISYKGKFRNYVVNDACVPLWTYVFVAVRNPALGESKSLISITDKQGKACSAYCLSPGEKQYKACPGVVSLTTDKPHMYSETLEDAKDAGFPFKPLEADSLDPRIQLSFLCY